MNRKKINKEIVRGWARVTVVWLVVSLGLGTAINPGGGNGYFIAQAQGEENYLLQFSSFIGGSVIDFARDVYVDSQGYIYLVGATGSKDFPTTTGPGFDNGACPSLGTESRRDGFVMKFDAAGKLVWSRLLGGPCYDRVYGIEVDGQGMIYLSGRAGEYFPVTPGAFQTTFKGTDQGRYGWQNGFVAKMASDSTLLWASYVGVGESTRDIAIDSSGNVYAPLTDSGQGGTLPATWFTNSYQKASHGGEESGAIKVNGNGSQVIWATWLGGSSQDSQATSIRVDGSGAVTLAFTTFSDDIPTTPGSFDRTRNGNGDFYVARLTPDGSNLMFATYLGGSGNDWVNTHNLALDAQGNAYVSFWTASRDLPTTPGAFQTQFGGGGTDAAIAKLSPSGGLLLLTYIGGTGDENADGIYVDSTGAVFNTGNTTSANFPTTRWAWQASLGGGMDATLFRLSADFSQLLYSTYMGGRDDDDGRSAFLGSDGSLYMGGSTISSDWPSKNPVQGTYGGGTGDAILARFIPGNTSVSPTSTARPGSTPAPTVTIPKNQDERNFLPLLRKQVTKAVLKSTPGQGRTVGYNCPFSSAK